MQEIVLFFDEIHGSVNNVAYMKHDLSYRKNKVSSMFWDEGMSIGFGTQHLGAQEKDLNCNK